MAASFAIAIAEADEAKGGTSILHDAVVQASGTPLTEVPFLFNGARFDPRKIPDNDKAANERREAPVPADRRRKTGDKSTAKQKAPRMRRGKDEDDQEPKPRRRVKAKQPKSDVPVVTPVVTVTKPAVKKPARTSRPQRAATKQEPPQRKACFAPLEGKCIVRVRLGGAELITPQHGHPYLEARKDIGGSVPTILRIEGKNLTIGKDQRLLIEVIRIDLLPTVDGHGFLCQCRTARHEKPTHRISFTADRSKKDKSVHMSLFTEDSRGAILITNLAKQKAPA